jgi:hypothetical protein
MDDKKLHENTAEASEYIICKHSATGCYDTILWYDKAFSIFLCPPITTLLVLGLLSDHLFTLFIFDAPKQVMFSSTCNACPYHGMLKYT